MGQFDRKYAPEQKDAALAAWFDKGIRPRKRVLELARNGQLLGADDRAVPAFDMPDGTFASYIKVERKRRTGRAGRPIAKAEPRDAVETLRQRVVSGADCLLEAYEKQLKRAPDKADPERLRQIARLVREAAAMPGPNDARPAKPGARQEGGVRTEGATRTALAKGILADIGGEPPRNATQEHSDTRQDAGRSAASTTQQPADGQMDRLPGSLALALDAS